MTKWMVIIFGCIIVISVLAFLLKSFVKVFLAFIIIALLFKIGFIWTPDEIINNLKLDRFVKSEYQERLEDGLNGLVDKRKDNEIIDANEIENVVKEVIDAKTQEALSKLSEVEVKKVMDDLSQKLEGLDDEEIDKKIKELIDKTSNKKPGDVPGEND